MNPYYTHFLNSTGSRDYIFDFVLSHFLCPTSILEIGVARDLNPATRDSDGWSSLHFARHIATHGGGLDLVDTSTDSLANCKLMTEGFNNLSYHLGCGAVFLHKAIQEGRTWDIINLDAGDDPGLTKEMFDLAKELKPKVIMIDDAHTKGTLIARHNMTVYRWPHGHEFIHTEIKD